MLEDEIYFDALANTTPRAIELEQLQEHRLATNISIAGKFASMLSSHEHPSSTHSSTSTLRSPRF